MILLYIYMYIKTCGWNVAIIRTGMRSTYAANAGRAYAWSVYVDPLPVCREGYQSQPGRILWRKLTCLFVFICLFFAGVVFGLSSVYVQGGNRISTMFSALAVRNIMPGVPSGCFTGSFWYGGIQCTVFHFLQTFLLSGHTLPYLPEWTYGPGFVRPFTTPFQAVANLRIIWICCRFLLPWRKLPYCRKNIFHYLFVKIYKTSRVSKQFDPLFCFLVKLHFWCVCMFLLKWPQYFIFPFRPVKVRLMLFKDVIWTCREDMYRFKGWPLPALLQRKGLQNTETGLNTSFLSFFICEETGEKCIPCRPDSVW